MLARDTGGPSSDLYSPFSPPNLVPCLIPTSLADHLLQPPLSLSPDPQGLTEVTSHSLPRQSIPLS